MDFVNALSTSENVLLGKPIHLQGGADSAESGGKVQVEIAIQDNEVTKRLASYAALVAVPTLIAGVYGMNFEHMPEIDWPLGYPLALASMVLIDLWLFWRFRRAGWL